MEYSILPLIIAISFLAIGLYLGFRLGALNTNRDWSKRLPEIRRDATKRSRAVLSGLVTEQMAPYLPGFAYNPTEARFIGKPIDLVIFEGMDEGRIKSVVFLEVKSGSSQLSGIEKTLKDAICSGNVRWEEYRI